ncbi:MAG TPA: 2-succinyl-5-enolpyruvyl-6-hydroxy-3-cyclohexene-1-carboxylic-acid synthase [Kineosporiaceae bacterium]|nr:2-succinyl-5-enolpyruvyl-6-hydroxy-3-cyclohexene-1-carboxylic-acid synthase [Kineosporiaceae bacterium]
MNPSTALAQVLVDTLVRLGVRHAVLCPGSRSSALAYALAAADPQPAAAGKPGLRLHVRIDERTAGFLALGLAKETGVPAVVVTTSGTAVANLHPAVLEAAHAGVPLIVLSADRPHELRGTGANQTTDQVKLFGDAVRLFAEIPAPDALTGQERAWRNTLSRAVAAALGTLGGRPGPVQVNVGFREPLIPDDEDPHDEDPPFLPPDPDAVPPPGLTRVRNAGAGEPVWLPDGPRTVVLAGDGAGPVAAEVAAGGGWPLLAEPSSGARRGQLAVGPYRLLLDRPGLGADIERVVVFGRPTLSRPVSRLLARPDVEVVVVSPRPDWSDAAGRAALVVPAARSVREHPDLAPPAGPDDPRGDWLDWLDRWLAADRVAAAAVDAVLDAEEAAGRCCGPLIARELAAALGPGEVLVAGASNSVRDLDLAARPFPEPAPALEAVVVLANRGLAGIDGTLSTACGVALARAADGRPLPVRALLGDLTFVHDASGLLSGPAERRPQVQVVLLDDDGGGIFGLLEPGARAGRGPGDEAVFERVFATPSGADLPALCAAVGAAYTSVGDPAGLRRALAEPASGVSVLHLRVDRQDHRALAGRIADAVRSALDAAGL